MFHTFAASGDGSSSTTNQKLPYGKAAVYIDSAAANGTPVFGGGTLTLYMKRADGSWSPFVAYTTEGGMPSNPLVIDLGPVEAEVYAVLSGATASSMYIEIVPSQTW